MYSDGINSAQILSAAQKFVGENDRKNFRGILQTIEAFAVAGGMIIGGKCGMYILCERPTEGEIDVGLWSLTLFSSKIEEDMCECARVLAKYLRESEESATELEYGSASDYRSVLVQTITASREYRLFANYRLVAVGLSLQSRKNIDVTRLLEPITHRGPFGTENAALLPVNLQIASALQVLCQPQNAGMWPEYLDILHTLFEKVEHYKTGGRRDRTEEPAEEEAPFVLEDCVLVGERAAGFYLRGRIEQQGRTQYLGSFEGINEYAKVRRLSPIYSDIRMPDDDRARKVTLKNERGADTMDIFDALSYCAIPVTRVGRVLVGSPIAVLRYMFVDLWALRFVLALREGDRGLAARYNFLIDRARALFAWCEHAEIDTVFPRDFVGSIVPKPNIQKGIGRHAGGFMVFSPASSKEMIAFCQKNISQLAVI